MSLTSQFWSIRKMRHNVSTLGEEADLEAHTFSLAQKPIGSTNVQFSTKTAFLPNVCYALVAVILAVNFNRSKVFCSFFVSGQKIIYFFLVRLVYMMYICTNKTDKK